MKAFWMRGIAVAGIGAWVLSGAAHSQQQSTVHAPDGGTIQRLQSITIMPLMNAPFTAVVNTEWTKIMPDGTTATLRNHRTVARDSAGRVFEERRYFSPTGDKNITQLTALQYFDPNRHERYNCLPAQKTCYLTTDERPAIAEMPKGIGGLEVCGCASPHSSGSSIQLEALGQKTMQDVDVTGSREITTLTAAQIGDEKSQPVVKEFWFSPRLGVNLVVKRFDPRSGIENFLVDHLSLNEPDPGLFEPPAEYQVVKSVVVKQGTAQARR